MVDSITQEVQAFITYKTIKFYAGFERKNISVFVKYDINDDHRMYFDIYNTILRRR